MAINSGNIKDRENNKFVESPTRPGQTAVEVYSLAIENTLTEINTDQSNWTQTAQTKRVPDATAAYAPTNATTTVLSNNLVIKNTSGTLFSFSCHNNKNQAQYIQLHNATALPADGSVPVFVFKINSDTSIFIEWSVFGRHFTNGIVICNSSTVATKTIGVNDCFFDVQYK